MKVYYKILLLLFISSNQYCQGDDITLYEKKQVNYCGKILILDGIWINDGKLKADISLLEQENSKPVTGGYSGGDWVMINDTCKLYVNFIEKSGPKDAVGYVVLTSYYIDMITFDNCNDKMELLNGQEYFLGNNKYKIKSNADEVILESKDESITLKKDDYFWNIKCLLKLTQINNDKATFERVKSYFYTEGGRVIPGELENPPVLRDEYALIIRKIPLQRKMNEPPYDEKISLLKVYFKVKEEAARPVIEYYIDGIKTYLVFDVVRTFDSEEEAVTYAKENNITDVDTK